MTVKRANGEGSVYQRKDGRWMASLRYSDPVSGESVRVALYGKSKTEASRKLREARSRTESGKPARDSARTVGAWLADWREGALAASSRAASTKDTYIVLCKTHLEPAPFGAVALDRLRPSHIDKLLLDLRGKKLAESTVRLIFTTLRLALEDAVRDGLVAENVAAKVSRPKPPRKEARFLTTAEVARLLDAAKDSRYHSLLVFIAMTGIRKGEALATKWTDIDFEAGTYRVPGTKSESSRRTLALSPVLVILLKARRKEQLEERMRAANVWTDTGLVFTTEKGEAVGPRCVLRALEGAATTAKLDGVCVHTLRHSAAATWLENGVNLKAVSELLGHADAAITAKVYAHVSPETKAAAMDVLQIAYGF